MSRAGRRGFADNDKMLFITKACWSSFREMVQKWVVFAFLGTTASSGRREEEKKRKKKNAKEKRHQATYKATARQAVKNQKTLRTELESLI